MFPSIEFLLATTAIVVVMMCYIILLAKLKPSNESSEFSELLRETEENLLAPRRMELLDKYKEERIREYLERKRKHESS